VVTTIEHAGSERRRHPRFRVTRMAGSVRRPLDARLLDISRGGVALEADQPLAVGQCYTFEVRDHARRVLIEVQCRWCTGEHRVNWPSGASAGVYRAGGALLAVHDAEGATGWWKILGRDGALPAIA
jgi:hypothetical protein